MYVLQKQLPHFKETIKKILYVFSCVNDALNITQLHNKTTNSTDCFMIGGC